MAEDLEHALHPNEAGTGKEGAGAPDKVKQRRMAKIAIAVGVVGAVIAWLAYKRQSAASTTPASTVPVATGTAAPSGGYVAGYQGSGGQGAALGDIGNALAGISAQLSSLSPSASAGSGTGAGMGETIGAPGTPGSAATPPPPGPSQITIGGQPYDVLGQVGSAAPGGGYNYTGYNVGGGADVLFGNQQGAAVGVAGIQPGAYAYTPTSNAGLVSSSTSTEVIGKP